MKFRKLERWEHNRTKALYETVFSEDKGAFADYYYTWKTRDNTIYVAEDENGIHAMVHLNPFEVSVYGKVRTLHYIVAVATEKEYRHRGLMRNLLNLAMREMAESGEPFTFLMPASEAIYLPFGFRFASRQRQGTLPAAREERSAKSEEAEMTDWEQDAPIIEESLAGSEETEMTDWEQDASIIGEGFADSEKTASAGLEFSGRIDGLCVECRPVRPEEYRMLADLVNRTLAGQADIFIWRNAAFYERLVEEQRCQNGDVMVVLADGKILGTFCTSQDEPGESAALELREIIVEEQFQRPVFEALRRFAGRNGGCRVYGCPDSLELAGEKSVPLLMAGRLDVNTVGSGMSERERVVSRETSEAFAGSVPCGGPGNVLPDVTAGADGTPVSSDVPERRAPVIFINEVV